MVDSFEPQDGQRLGPYAAGDRHAFTFRRRAILGPSSVSPLRQSSAGNIRLPRLVLHWMLHSGAQSRR
eukprot:8715379-Karenia_brevis.AAC.1